MSVLRVVGAVALTAGVLAACTSFGSTAPPSDGGPGVDGAVGDGARSDDAGSDGPATDAATDRAAAYAAAVLADNPVGYWRLHDQQGATQVASEVSPMLMAGVFEATQPTVQVAGIFGAGGAYRFDGAKGEIITVPAVQYYGDGNVTVEAWFRPTSATDGNYRHIFEHSVNKTGSAYGVWLEGDQVGGERYNNNLNITHSVPYPQLGGWHYVAMTIASGEITLYFDGVVSTGTNHSNVNPNLVQPFSIGCKSPGDVSIQGDLTEVALYNDALAFDRISQHYVLGKPP